jgi:ribosome-binding protein aMBF1 (putative translation factor)
MEMCSICGKPINNEPHITCASCKATICYQCYQNLDDKTKCPICVRKGKTIKISLSSDLAVKIAQNVKGSDFNDKLLKCAKRGYKILIANH